MKNHTLFYANGLIVIAFIATIAHLLYGNYLDLYIATVSAEWLNVDCVLASELQFDNGHFSGKFSTPCSGLHFQPLLPNLDFALLMTLQEELMLLTIIRFGRKVTRLQCTTLVCPESLNDSYLWTVQVHHTEHLRVILNQQVTTMVRLIR